MKDKVERLKRLYDAFFAFGLGLSIIIISESQLHYTIRIVLLVTSFIIIIDDWWLTQDYLDKYPPKTNFGLAIELVYLVPILSILFTLAMTKEDTIWINGFFFSMSLIYLLDLVWCLKKIKEYPRLKKGQVDMWARANVALFLMFFTIFILSYFNYLTKLFSSIICLTAYVSHRFVLDYLIPRVKNNT